MVGAPGAGSLALASDPTVMGIGGFMGSDLAPILQQFQAYVAAYQVHYFTPSSGPAAVLVIVWNLLATGALYDDPGAIAQHKRNDEQPRCRAIRQLEALGSQVTVKRRQGDAT